MVAANAGTVIPASLSGHVACSTSEALDGTPMLSVQFHALENHAPGSLRLIAGPYDGEASVYDGESFGGADPEALCSGPPCWGVWWSPASDDGKGYASTFQTHDCRLEVTPHETDVVGEFECARLSPGDLVLTDGHFACALGAPSSS
jgi:hypothetical protein